MYTVNLSSRATGVTNLLGTVWGAAAPFVNGEVASSQGAAVTRASSLIIQRNITAHNPHMFNHNMTEKSCLSALPYSN